MLAHQSLTELFQQIVDIESVSRNETRLADEVERTLAGFEHLHIVRDGDAVVARTALGRRERVLIAGHLDTVPVVGNLPFRLADTDQGQMLVGRGSVDMKGGVAVMVHLAARLANPGRDITWVFYDCEEIEETANGLGRLLVNHPELFTGITLGVLMEPTATLIEGGCQGTLRFTITTKGLAAHSARSWLGRNAIHELARVIERVEAFEARQVNVDGLEYREGLNATMVSGGLAPNVIPDSATVQINYRFAPDKTLDEAVMAMTEWFDGWELIFVDRSPAARPGLDRKAAAEFVAAVGGTPRAKYGWTDVARLAAAGIPAVNYGPGDPGKAHQADEACPIAEVEACTTGLMQWLGGASEQEA